MPTAQILAALHALDEAPWADMSGKPLDSRQLAKRLGEYVTVDNQPIKARNMRNGESVAKGYYATDLHDAWARYCPPPGKSATSATLLTPAALNSGNAVAEATGPARLPGDRHVISYERRRETTGEEA